jgi:hypothetical protein
MRGTVMIQLCNFSHFCNIYWNVFFLVDLIGKTWKVFRVSPLHNFEYTTVRMKQYSLRLREGLTTLLTDLTKDAHYDVNFSVAEGLAETQNDSQAVKVGTTCKLCKCLNRSPEYP